MVTSKVSLHLYFTLFSKSCCSWTEHSQDSSPEAGVRGCREVMRIIIKKNLFPEQKWKKQCLLKPP